MDIGDLVYVLIGVIWLIYSFLKKGNKKTTSDLSGLPSNAMTEQPVEEYLPSDLSRTEDREVVEQVEDPYETVRKEIFALSEPVVSEPCLPAGRAEPDEREEPYIEQLKGATQTPTPTLTHSFQKKGKALPARHSALAGGCTNSPLPFGEGLPDFDLRKAIVFYEILKRPEY